MDIGKTISESAVHRVIMALVFGAMYAMPWINRVHISTFLLILSGIIIVFSGKYTLDFNWYKRQVLFRLFFVYYFLLIIVFLFFPAEIYSKTGLEQKASLLFLPFLSRQILLIIGLRALVGNKFSAAFVCLVSAVFKFSTTKYIEVFFYHQYASPLKLNAIYFSLYIIISLGYIIQNNLNNTGTQRPKLMTFLGLFLLLNLFLLSSKIMIVTGLLLLLILIFLSWKNRVFKMGSLALIILFSLIIIFTNNPVKSRYENISYQNFLSSYQEKNFKDFPFDGLSLRLVLWRLGIEMIGEKGLYLFGAGGERYHESLNGKIIAYQLYSGDGTEKDRGYLNYNLHNQYIETYVQFGIAGAAILLSILTYTFWHAIARQSNILIYILMVFSLGFLTESFLETQSGIILFTILISGEWILLQKSNRKIIILT